MVTSIEDVVYLKAYVILVMSHSGLVSIEERQHRVFAALVAHIAGPRVRTGAIFSTCLS